jgi:hypothetical protein
MPFRNGPSEAVPFTVQKPALNGMGHLCAKQRATEGSCGERPPSGLVRTQSGRNLGIAVALAPEIPFGRELKV